VKKDICYLTFPEKEQTKLDRPRRRNHFDLRWNSENTFITVPMLNQGEIMGTYVPNSVTGHYVIVLPPGRNYSISYEATDFLFQSDNINVSDSTAFQIIDRPVSLEPLKVARN